MKIIQKTLTILLIILTLATVVAAADEYEFNSKVVPHTRYNYLLYKCYYYYGYGRCEVNLTDCQGVPVGDNKWVDLGDACNRNEAPILTGARDIMVNEGDLFNIPGECEDNDPTEISYTGWAVTKEKYAGYNDAGTHKVTITCTDSFGETDSKEIKIVVNDKNRSPFFKFINYMIEKK